MQQFKIGEAGVKKFRKKWLTITLPLMTVILIVVSVTNILSTKAGEVNTWPFVITFLVAYFSFNIYRSFKKQKKALLSYCLTLSEEGVTREQLNTPPLSISFMEIREIIKTEKGGFRIKGVNRNDVIHVPHFIDDPVALEESLQTLAPITVGTKDPFYRKYRAVLMLPLMGMLVCVYAVSNKIIVGICAPILVGLFIWAFFEIHTNRNLPRGVKRASWVLLILISSIIYMTYAKMTGTWDPR